MAAKPATAPATDDPVKTLQGMFNGAVTRMAQALKDPLNYGPNTKIVLTEVAKRFHDALDDCEVQLLDAKWYLEHKLALNKSRREAKARELGTAVKRKHDELLEQQAKEETPAKKQKVEGENKPTLTEPENPPNASEEQADKPKDKGKEEAERKTEPTKQEDLQTASDDFTKPSPQVTPAATTTFNIESMFGDSQNGADDDLNFDLELDNSFDMNGATNDGGSANKKTGEDVDDLGSLDALLPGLGDYANQAGELTTMGATDSDALPPFSNDFDLPEVGGGNDFDDFLKDESLGTGDYGGDFNIFDDSLFNS